jgi:hypothetical protein
MKDHRLPGPLATGLIWFTASIMAFPPGIMAQVLAASPPTVLRHTVNDGSPQRSTVTNLSLVFSTNVSITPSNLVIRNLATNAPIDPTNFALTYDPISSKATLSFPGLPGRSLPDGNFIGAVLPNTVTNPAGLRLDGSAEGHPGAPYVFDLFRHFGDWNGDRDIDFWDNYWFQRTFDRTAADTNYDARFDFDLDGVINSNDLRHFQSNYFTVLAPAPGIFAALVDDTGASLWDNITSDPTIAGGLVNTNLVRFFQAQFDTTNGGYFDVSSDLAARGSFWFTSNRLAEINAGPLADGPHTLYLRTLGTQTNVNATFALSFLLDTAAPPITLTLDPRDDSPPAGDFTTTNTLVRLVGQTEPNLTVTLSSISPTNSPRSTSADGAGGFVFTNLPLSPGSNLFHADTADLAGNRATAGVTVTNITPGPCVFANLDGWSVTTSGWGLTNLGITNPIPGSVKASNCEAVMTEGDSFLVTFERGFVVPQPATNNAGPVSLQFTYAGLSFDRTTSNAIKDAFEAAIVDDQGNALTYVIGDSRDACFSQSDGHSVALASGVTIGPSALNPQFSTVSVSLDSLFPGRTFKLILRLINNDRDRVTSVRISDVRLLTATTGTPAAKATAVRSVPAQPAASPHFAIATNISVPAGLQAEVFAIVTNPLCLAFALQGTAFGTDLYVGGGLWSAERVNDPNDHVFRVSSDGTSTVFATLAAEADPNSIRFPPLNRVLPESWSLILAEKTEF